MFCQRRQNIGMRKAPPERAMVLFGWHTDNDKPSAYAFLGAGGEGQKVVSVLRGGGEIHDGAALRLTFTPPPFCERHMKAGRALRRSPAIHRNTASGEQSRAGQVVWFTHA